MIEKDQYDYLRQPRNVPTNKIFIKHTRQWFVLRIGKKIMREEGNFKGVNYNEVEFEIRNLHHAYALFTYQKDFNLRYKDITV